MKRKFISIFDININLPEDLSKDETILYLAKFYQKHSIISLALGMVIGAVLTYFILR